MEALTNFRWTLRLWKDSRAQDLVEYALIAGFLAVGAGAVVGSIAENVSPVFSKVIGVIDVAVDAGQPVAVASGAGHK